MYNTQKSFNKFSTFLVLNIAFFILFLGIITYLQWFMLEQHKKQECLTSVKAMRTALDSSHNSIRIWIKNRERELKNLAASPELITLIEQQLQEKKAPNSLKNSNASSPIQTILDQNVNPQNFISLSVIGPDHRNIAANIASNLGTQNPISDNSRKSLDKVFLGQTVFIPPTVLTGISLENDIEELNKKQPLLFIATPIIDKANNIIAALAGAISFEGDISRLIDFGRTGTTGKTYFFDNSGKLLSIAHLKKQFTEIGNIDLSEEDILNIEIQNSDIGKKNGHRTTSPNTRQPLPLPAYSALTSATGEQNLGYKDFRGVLVLGLWIWDEELNIGIAAEIDKTEAEKHTNFSHTISFWIISASVIFSLVFPAIVLKARSLGIKLTNESEEKVRLLLNHTVEAIYGLDKDGRCTFANPSCIKMLGYKDFEDLAGKNMHTLIRHSREDGTPYPQEKCHMLTAFQQGKGAHVDNEVLWRADGTSFNAEYWAHPLYINKERVGAVVTFIDITKRKQVEQTLKRSQSSLAEAQRIAHFGNWEWHIEANELYWSDEIYRIFGVEPNEFQATYDAFIQFVHPDERDKVSQAVKNAVKKKIPYDLDHKIIRSDGSERVVREVGEVFYDKEGKPIRMVGTVHDITKKKEIESELIHHRNKLEKLVEERTADLQTEISERKQTEAALHRKSEELQATLNALPDQLFHLDADGIFLDYKASDISLENMAPSDYIGKRVDKVLPDKVGRDVIDAITKSLKENTLVSLEYSDPQHEEPPLYEMRIVPYLKNQVILLRRDVTDEKKSEKRLKILSRAIEQSPVSVIITDSNGLIEYVNPKFTALTQYTDKEVLGKTPRILKSGTHPASFYNNMWKTVLAGNEWHGEICNRKKDGEFFWELASISSIKDEEGILSHLVAVKEDITIQKQMVNELKKAKEAAEQANKAKSVFLSSMSHELRTPLNSILGFSQLLDTAPSTLSDSEQKAYINKILRSGQHLLQLINDILDLAKIESGAMDITIEPVSLVSTFEETSELIKQMAQVNNINLVVETPAPQFFIKADRVRLQQVILNLLSNAIKYNQPGGKVTFFCEKSGEKLLRINIEDNGPGIPPENIDRVFKPFDRLGAEASSIEGSGIGLTITKRLMEQMGGTINFSSQEGKGSTFFVEFPIASPPSKEKTDKNNRGQTVFSKLDFECTLLYVEDNRFNRQLIEAIVKPHRQIKLLTAENGLEGLEMANTHKPDLIFMDIGLPDRNGFEVLKELSKNKGTSEIPVVALSADAMPNDIERAMNAGFIDYLTKPVNLGHFFKVITKALNR